MSDKKEKGKVGHPGKTGTRDQIWEVIFKDLSPEAIEQIKKNVSFSGPVALQMQRSFYNVDLRLINEVYSFLVEGPSNDSKEAQVPQVEDNTITSGGIQSIQG